MQIISTFAAIMRRYYYILIAILCTTACKASNPKDDKDSLLKQNIIRNKVHFIKAYEYEYKSGIIDSASRFLANSDEYDRKGNLITHLIYHPHENSNQPLPIDSIINVFDDNGNLLKLTQIKHESSHGSGKAFNRYVKVFEHVYENNKKSKSSIYNNGELYSKIKYQYNSDGSLAAYTSYDKYGEFDLKTSNIYVNGEISEVETIDKNNRIEYRTEIVKKDKYHKVITVFKGKNVILSVQKQELDNKGQLIQDDFKMESFKNNRKYTYNDWGALTSSIAYNDQNKPVGYTKIEIVKF